MVALLSVVVLVLLSTVQCQTGGNSTPPAASIFKNIPLVDEYPATRSGAAVGTFAGTSTYGFVILGGDLAYGGDTRAYSYTVDKNISKWAPLNTKFSVSDACSVQDPANMDYLYIYGGTEAGTNFDLYQYQISKDTLTKIDFKDTLKPPTQGATCAIRNGTLYIVTGDCGSEIFTFDTTAKDPKWVNATVAGGPTGGRKGASGLLFGDEIVLWGGNCGGVMDTDVWRYDLLAKKWSSEKSTSDHGPDARSYHSAVVDSISTGSPDAFIIFGGEVGKQTMNDTWTYSLANKNWTSFTPSVLTNSTWKFVPTRQNANVAYIYGRMFVFSGLVSANTTANDFWELVITSDCYKLTNTCGTCVITDGCGWCAGNLAGYQCVPGRDNIPYIAETCAPAKDDNGRPYINDLCPPEGFPGWIIALIIVITILAIGVVWYFVIRCQKKSSGYDQIN